MGNEFKSFARKIYYKYPILRPYMAFVKNTYYLFNPKFSGWGMRTNRELPWIDEFSGETFRRAMIDVKKKFEFNKNIMDTHLNNIDSLLWRHWIVSSATRYAIEFADTKVYNFVECGVGEGFSAFFMLREISVSEKLKSKWSMHLYDAWSGMREQVLLENEKFNTGRYSNLTIDLTKQNLQEFEDNVIYHQGHIPDSFGIPPKSPDTIVFLSIDLGSANATLSVLEFFFHKLVRGGVILFNEYGDLNYNDTKKIIDKFFSDKPGMLMKFPTGQTIYYR